MSEEQINPAPWNMEHYLGDGLYASYDGYQIKLRAPRENGESVVFLECQVYNELLTLGKRWGFQNER